MMSYDFTAGLMPVVEPKLTMPAIEASANQQQLLEQLLFALTNQLALAAQNTTNQSLSAAPSMYNAFKANGVNSNQSINKYNSSGASPKRTNSLSNNHQLDFERKCALNLSLKTMKITETILVFVNNFILSKNTLALKFTSFTPY